MYSQTKNKTFKLLFSLILIGSLLFFPSEVRTSFSKDTLSQEQLIKEMQEELYQKIKSEMKDYIREEVKRQVKEYYASHNAIFKDKEALPPSLSQKRKTENQLHALFQQTISQEIQVLKNQDLDQYIASGRMDPNVFVSDGYNKEILLASNSLQDSRNYSKDDAIEYSSEDLNITGEGEKSESIERTLVQRGNMLLPKGTLQFEPSITWAHFSSNNIHIQGFSVLPVLVIGDISTRKIKRDIFINNYAFKYGLLNNFQTEVKIPMRYEHDRETDTSFLTEETKTGGGMGDIEFGFSRQIGWEKGFMPDLIASINVKTPTAKSYNKSIALGTGHWSFRTALIAAKSSDPTVIFGNLYYTYTLPRDVEGIGRVIPGENIGYSVGTAIALSYQTAINFSFDHSISFKSESAGRMVKGSFLNVASFKAGLNWAISEKSSVDLGVSIGITDDAPDASVTVRFPYVF